ncbi:hypothetical protein BOX15_Mlig009311g1 [Macrostomum lignano]|uniref:Uncharacterized protein n=1 Tax=Macrostomum lignano TaxID=282301 RepID=A0A267H7T1_9PLAT|nr:hypothetical protein BOX15_Mlig009311g1 [Macrostomum lignano]
MLRLANNGFAKHFGWLKHGHQLLPVPSTFQALSRRSILSASFSCPDAWQSRLSAHDAVSGLDLGNGLLRALDRREPVAPVDVDIYANKLDSFELSYLPYFSNVLAKFRVTQESLGKLESTDHALVRCMISLGQAELLVDWLRDKFTYGIFLDQFSASLLIDHLYEAGDARLAALVAFDHALQDLPSDGWPCTGLMLLASISRAANQLSEWTTAVSADANADGEEAAEEDDEDDDSPDTQHVIVDYIRRPNYDNYFDIEEERLQVGLTLARVGRRLLAEWPGQPAGLACLLIGLAAWEKPDELLSVLRQQQLPAVSESTLLVVDSLLGSARCLGNGKVNEPGKRPRCRPEAIEEARAAVKALPKAQAPSAEESWHAELFAVAHRLVAEHEAKSASRLAALYAEFARVRLAELRSHGDWLRKRRLFRDVKSRLDDLVGEQESLTAFDRAAEIRYAAWLAPRTRAESRVTSAQIWRADIANADRLLDEASEAAARGGGRQQATAAALLRRSTITKEKFRPLKE